MLGAGGRGQSPVVDQGAFYRENGQEVFVVGAQSRGARGGWAAVQAQAMQGLECHFNDQSLA